MEDIKENLENAEEVTAVKEPTIEDYKKACDKLVNDCNTLYKQLQEANMINVFKRLDYLFKVLECKDSFGAAFTKDCAKEIQDLIVIKEESPKNIKENKKENK